MSTESTLTFRVPGMSCGHCQMAVGTEIRKVDGVSDVAIDLGSKLVVVTGRDLDPAKLYAAVDEAGYEAVA